MLHKDKVPTANITSSSECGYQHWAKMLTMWSCLLYPYHGQHHQSFDEEIGKDDVKSIHPPLPNGRGS